MCISQVVYEQETESLGMSVFWVTHGELSSWQVNSGEGAGLVGANRLLVSLLALTQHE